MKEQMIFRVIDAANDEVIAIFNNQSFAQDFIDYQKTISEKEFEIEKLSLANWLVQSREF